VVSYRYYYFVPQLAHLVYGQPPPISSEAFRAKAAPVLGEKDAAMLAMLSLDPPPPPEPEQDGAPKKARRAPESSGCEFVDGWREWEKALRLNLARLRAARLGRDGELFEAPASPSSALKAAARALEAETPLDGEAAIDKARWDAVEALQGADLFHRRTIFAHFTKLLILERQASFQAEAGFMEYKSLYDSILEQSSAGPAGAAPVGEPK